MTLQLLCVAVFVLVFNFLSGCASTSQSPPAIRPIDVVVVDPKVISYATFQSHNQKVLANRRGIFFTFNRTRNEAYTAQNWRLMRSTDGGKTFTIIYEQTNATNPPVIETDPDDNLYLIRSDDLNHNEYFYRFSAADNYVSPVVTVIPYAAAGKFASAIDVPRKQIYFFSHNESFNVVDFNGKILRTTQRLLQPGKDAYLQYPQLSLDIDGTLHAAWTTQWKDGYLYWDIHHMLSKDGGATWQNLNGTPLTTPVVGDQHGPAMRITRDDEFESHTWLSSFMALNGKVHFAYLAQTKPARMHYLRYDIATSARDVDIWPEFKGETLKVQGLDGFFSARNDDPKSPIYFTMRSGDRIACLVSHDNGATWHDFALSEPVGNPYSVGGCRRITDDGYIIGTFVDQVPGATPADVIPKCRLIFFKIKVK